MRVREFSWLPNNVNRPLKFWVGVKGGREIDVEPGCPGTPRVAICIILALEVILC
jgi:hypothetical protein